MNQKTWFKDWFNSPYYHLLYNKRNDNEAQLFIERLIAYLNPPASATMLDVACGKGRHSKVLADLGFDVTGIDLSSESIAEAQKNECDHLHFYEHDMRLPFWINYFNCAFNFFTSFGYFKTEREHNNAIRSIAQSLTSKGTFVIDYLNVKYTEQNLEPSAHIEIENIHFHITKWHTEQHFFKQIQVADATSNALKHLYTEKVAKFTLADFTDMLSYQGLQIQEVFGDYELKNYDAKKSPRLIIVAKKI
ncbi:MAG: class I SAM-dependent methyltransferase [Chitinophagaceae bacterium]